MVVDISTSKSPISHASPYSPEAPEVQFQLTLLHFHQLSFSLPPLQPPCLSTSVTTFTLFFFFFSPSVCHSVVNVRIQTSSHGYQHGNAQINTRGASPSLIFQQRTIISLRSSVFICVCDLACNLPSGQNAEHSPHSNGQRERITHCSL